MGSQKIDVRSLSHTLKSRAEQLGFSAPAIAPARPSPHLDAYLRWIDAGMHGSMAYLARPDRIARREDLTIILPGARSLIIVAMNYFTGRPPPEVAESPRRGRVSNYAWGEDYHTVMETRLDTLAGFVQAETGGNVATQVYVDTGAILERSHAEQAGLGFVGKNTMLIHPRRGSFFFLGEIVTDIELVYDEPPDMPECGNCTRCLSACPTQAFTAPYVLDARRCISYLTIEYKGVIPVNLRPLIGNRIYGCDVCQQVCPWQRFAQPASQDCFTAADAQHIAPPLADLLALDAESFSRRFQSSPVRRIGRDRLARNACVAAGNSDLPELARWLIPLLRDESPLVRGHAAWALGRLDTGHDALRSALIVERDQVVRDEIERATLLGPGK
ncbi:MAG: tRNA epoxyqueuosine(34) reductase QueG [Anaerolineae bacterium]|nr:tRNA epoxyqueuosine(34) reductase QueG [Anaerolineae bacterium]